MDILFFLFCLFALQIACLILGSRDSKRNVTEKDYFLAGRSLSWFPLMMTFVATQVGGGLVLGAAEEAYQYGYVVLLYPLGAVLGLAFLAAGIGKRMALSGVSTIAELFEVSFGSKVLKQVASILSIISLFMILVAQFTASKKFMVSLGVDNPWVFYSFWGLVIAYTAIGGFKAVVSTDSIQAIFFIVTFFACLVASLWGISFLEVNGALSNSNAFALAENKFSGWLLMPLLFMLIEQDMGQRCFAARSPKTVSIAAMGAALLTMAICSIPVFLGILAKSQGVLIKEGSSVLMEAVQTFTNPQMAALAGCAVIAAIISTADSLINAISSNLSQDFNLKFLKDSIKRTQVLSAVIALFALGISIYFKNIVDLLIQSYELSVCCLFIPVLFALFKSKTPRSRLSAALSIGFGAFSFIYFKIITVDFPKEVLSVGISLLGYGLGEFIEYLLAKREKSLELS